MSPRFRERNVILQSQIEVVAEVFDLDKRPWPDGVQVRNHYDGKKEYFIDTLKGARVVIPGDWIIIGTTSERSSCKPDVFEMTYVPVEAKTNDVKISDYLDKLNAWREAKPAVPRHLSGVIPMTVDSPWIFELGENLTITHRDDLPVVSCDHVGHVFPSTPSAGNRCICGQIKVRGG